MPMSRVLIIFYLLFSSTAFSQNFRIYHIGNSLTWDCRPVSIKNLLLRNGYDTVQQGYHIDCSQNLKTIVNDRPTSTCVPTVAPYGPWPNALGEHEWDAITLQAFSGTDGASEIQATADLITAATSNDRNQDCIFFLYLAWPKISESQTFSEQMAAPFQSGNDSVELTSEFLDFWFSGVKSLHPDVDIRVIPTGTALSNIDQKLDEIPVPSFESTYDFFRDTTHLSLTEGRHFAQTMMFCSITGICPGDISFTQNYLSALDPEISNLTSSVIDFTLNADPRTGIARNPELNLSLNRIGGLECNFTGRLYTTTDLINWTELPDAISPHRVSDGDEEMRFYRAAR